MAEGAAFRAFVMKRAPRQWQADVFKGFERFQIAGMSPVDAGNLIKAIVRRVVKTPKLDFQDQQTVFNSLIDIHLDPKAHGETMPGNKYGYDKFFRKHRDGKLRIHYREEEGRINILFIGYRKNAYTKAAAQGRK